MDLQTVAQLNSQSSLEGVSITPEDAFVLSRVNGVSTIAEIQQIVGFDEEKIRKIFAKLHKHNLITFKDQKSTEDAVKNDKKITNTIQNKIRQKYAVVEKGDHYQILAVPKGASKAVITKSYFALSKEFHPDRFFKEPLGPFKKMLEEVFDAIQQSYQVLSDPDLKKQYFEQRRKRKIPAAQVKKEEDDSPLARRLKNVEYDLSSASAQYEMGEKEEARGNLPAALNFYKMALMFDQSNSKYKKACVRLKEALKNPVPTL